MTNWQIYITWGILILIGFAVSGLSKQVERFREEFREFIRYEEEREPEFSLEDAGRMNSDD